MMLHEGVLTSDEQFPVITSGETLSEQRAVYLMTAVAWPCFQELN